MSTLSFDSSGYLKPNKVIPIEWEELEEFFVFNHKRAQLFIELKALISEMSLKGISKFFVWIDGSFASLKANPNDIDLVCFVDHQQYGQNQKLLTSLRSQFPSLDVYFIKQYPEDHANYFLTNFDQLDWLHFFTRDRHNNKKGILKLTFER